MLKIGIFGGTFDPPHNGHIAILKAVLDRFFLNKIYVVPSGNPPHKQNLKITDKLLRFDMAKAVLCVDKRIEISDYELKKDEKSYSLELVKHFKALFPTAEVFLIIGADSLHDLPEWYRYKELIQLCEFIVVSRKSYQKDTFFDCFSKNDVLPKVHFIDNLFVDVSSTQLRQAIAENKPVHGLLPEETERYIKNNNLYAE